MQGVGCGVGQSRVEVCRVEVQGARFEGFAASRLESLRNLPSVQSCDEMDSSAQREMEDLRSK